MTEKYDSKFHRQYVGGTGEIAESKAPYVPSEQIEYMTVERIREEYRWYIGEPTAELPEEILEQLRLLGKI